MRRHRDRILRQVRASRRRGWWLIPIPTGKKAPQIKGWPQLRLTASELEESLGPNDGIGAILGEASNGLVDIDIDALEALAAAREFLPPTERIHGRKGKPSSHFWYHLKRPPAPEQFADLDGTMLIEFRSTGQQTVIPPTFHPSGERFVWSMARNPGRVNTDALQEAVRRLAACGESSCI